MKKKHRWDFYPALLLLIAAVALFCDIPAVEAQSTSITINRSETAQISGFFGKWNETILDRRRFDAAHRRLLIRFPGAAEKISKKLKQGFRIKTVELLLPFRKTELFPKGYRQRSSFGVKKVYEKVRPNWHAVAWALRHPWTADEDLGPTFNAWIKDVAFWEKAGAGSEEGDHFPGRFGPVKVSIFQARDIEDPMVGEDALGPGAEYRYHADQQPSPNEAVVEDPSNITPARMDVTKSVTDTAFGDSIGARLHRLSESGFMVRKWETYDFRFRKGYSYPWAVSTGGRAIVIHSPRLKVTFEEGSARGVDLPQPADVEALARKLDGTGRAGEPPLTMPNDKEIQRRLDRHGFSRREWMTDWQWKRVRELRQYGGEPLPQNPEQYKTWVKKLLKEQPRYWDGWDNAERLLAYYRYHETLPEYVSRHYFHDYWAAWLRPNTPTDELVHPWPGVAARREQTNPFTYYRKTGNWRGNASFYRRGFTHNISTMNFNHTASMGALLGGQIIGSEIAMQDGRHGLEHYPMRLWAWKDGSTQESIDHYYFALTLVAQKMFADFGPKHVDRMMGRSILAKSVDELASAYHPHLRHFIATSTRTGTPEYLLATQDGTQHIIHTLSRKGALHDLNREEIPDGMKRFGHDVSPVEAQQMTMVRPWAPKWMANVVDQKPLPYRMTNAYTEWGHHSDHPLWRRSYLGEHYGLASTDVTKGTVEILGQWRRGDKTVEKVQQLGTMDAIYAINTPQLATPKGGNRQKGGVQATLHHENKMVVVTSPYQKFIKNRKTKDIQNLMSTIGFYNYEEPSPSWKVFIDGDQMGSLPAKANTGQRILIHDGNTYIGLIPLPSTNLGGAGVRLHQLDPQKGQTGAKTQVAMAIENYNFRRQKTTKKPGKKKMDAAYGGWVIEYGDVTEYENFRAFRRHMKEVKLKTNWKSDQNVLEVTYKSGDDTLEMGVNTMYRGGSTKKLFTHRKVNGKWPYLEENRSRDTTLTKQGRAPVLKKNGAKLKTEPGKMAYLQTEPISKTYVGFNPLPDMNFFELHVPGGVRVRTDGRVGITRVMIRPTDQLVRVDHALKKKQKKRRPDRASAFFVSGMDEKPDVELNDEPVADARVRKIQIEGKQAWVVPVRDKIPGAKKLKERYRRSQEAFHDMGK